MAASISFCNIIMISPENTWLLWGICILGASSAVLLEQRYKWAAKVGGTLIALFMAVMLSNMGIIPRESTVWDAVWNYLIPFCLPMLLFRCNIKCLSRDVGRILTVFLIGTVGTATGSIAGFYILRQKIPQLDKLAGAFTGTYTGGRSNFTEICSCLGIGSDVASSAAVADDFLMSLYFVVLTLLPAFGFFRRQFMHPLQDDIEADAAAFTSASHRPYIPAYSDGGPISIRDIAVMSGISAVIVSISHGIAGLCAGMIPQTNVMNMMAEALLGNVYVWICVLSILCASLMPDFLGNINGTYEIGTFIIYIFFFVIGVPVSAAFILNDSAILLLYALIVIVFNMLFCFAVGKLLGCSLEEIIIASNANIGGPATAAAMAVTKGWSRLAGPAIIVGVLGYALGTYLGLIVGSLLGA